MPDGDDLARIADHFRLFAASFSELPLYGRLSEAIAEDTEVSGLLLEAQPGQARPVLLFAAAHDLVLQHPDLPAASWYRSITAAHDVPEGDPYPAFREMCLDHADELRAVISQRRTQTNEVNRVVSLAPMLAAAAADVADLPLTLVELGASAGLLLGVDRYRVDVGGEVSGDADSPVHLAGVMLGAGRPPVWGVPPAPGVVERVGIDVDPVLLDDAPRVRWLEACLWPDQPERIDRFRAAVSLLKPDPPRLVTGDLIDALPATLAGLRGDTHLVVFHSWALTYVERQRRVQLSDVLSAAAADGRPVSWLSAEAPRCVPGIQPPSLGFVDEMATPETVLGMRAWRNGVEEPPTALGWTQPHGAWLSWNA